MKGHTHSHTTAISFPILTNTHVNVSTWWLLQFQLNCCSEPPFGYPMTGDAAPCWSSWEGDMLPQVCLLALSPTDDNAADGGTPGGQADGAATPPEKTTEVGGCTYSAPLLGKFLPGCAQGCKAHAGLAAALAACSQLATCGGVTQSADQGQNGFQLRASTVPHEQPPNATPAAGAGGALPQVRSSPVLAPRNIYSSAST